MDIQMTEIPDKRPLADWNERPLIISWIWSIQSGI
jgi:hypothetical protein